MSKSAGAIFLNIKEKMSNWINSFSLTSVDSVPWLPEINLKL